MKDLTWFIEGIRDELISLASQDEAEQEEGLRLIAARIALTLTEPRPDTSRKFSSKYYRQAFGILTKLM